MPKHRQEEATKRGSKSAPPVGWARKGHADFVENARRSFGYALRFSPRYRTLCEPFPVMGIFEMGSRVFGLNPCMKYRRFGMFCLLPKRHNQKQISMRRILFLLIGAEYSKEHLNSNIVFSHLFSPIRLFLNSTHPLRPSAKPFSPFLPTPGDL